MSNATFFNFTDKTFTGRWNGKPKAFKPGERQLMPAWLAEHFAKHLTNQVLIESGKEVYTSPKKPGQVPEFMEVFNKCYIPEKKVAGGNEIDDIIATAAVDGVLDEGPSSNITVKELKADDENSPAAAQAIARGEDPNPQPTNQEDPYTPTGNEVGPGNGSTIIGEEAGDEDDDYQEDNSAEGAA